MQGPDILARSLTAAQIADKFDNTGQYHSRSDSHSKIACWTLLFDLLHHCPLLVRHVTEGKVGFGINHEMHDFRTGRQKYLDLVLCTPGGSDGKHRETFASLAQQYGVQLTSGERAQLNVIPE